MATPAINAVESLTKKLETLPASDTADTVINVSCWNILGEPACTAGDRQKVTTATFNHKFNGTSLGQADIICVQEMKFKPTLPTAEKYFPFAKTYHCEESEEKEKQGIYNAVYFNKDKFKIAHNEQIKRAFELLNLKKEVYEKIAKKGDSEIEKALKGTLPVWGDTKDKENMCKEVLDEIKGKKMQDFHNNLAKYRAKDEMDMKHPKVLLNRRMAICCLTIKSLSEDIIAISIHNYSKGHSESFARLFFEFLEKLRCPVIIAGDFNLDILSGKVGTQVPEFKPSNYITKDYTMRQLRRGLTKIDFILIKKGAHDGVEFSFDQMAAHDFQIPSGVDIKKEKDISNHNPISAAISVTT